MIPLGWREDLSASIRELEEQHRRLQPPGAKALALGSTSKGASGVCVWWCGRILRNG